MQRTYLAGGRLSSDRMQRLLDLGVGGARRDAASLDAPTPDRESRAQTPLEVPLVSP